MNHPNLQQLATEIHEANKAAGWWDTPRPRVQTAWLVITELAEATEAERKVRYADLKAFESEDGCITKNPKFITDESELVVFAVAFRKHIKDTFEDEIADAVIRLLDFAASEGVSLKLYNRHLNQDVSNESVFFYVTDCCFQAGKDFPRIGDENKAKAISSSISQLVALSNLRGFDLWQHIELKRKYNATRPKMHGGKNF